MYTFTRGLSTVCAALIYREFSLIYGLDVPPFCILVVGGSLLTVIC